MGIEFGGEDIKLVGKCDGCGVEIDSIDNLNGAMQKEFYVGCPDCGMNIPLEKYVRKGSDWFHWKTGKKYIETFLIPGGTILHGPNQPGRN